jgi:asparagine synthase (glutamine-hydrolysing)
MVSPSGAPLAAPDQLERMSAALKHRGPDGSDARRAPDAAIGAERLRVIDLNPRADQPFADPSGDVWLCCNGEIYNAPELRRRFPRYPFRSRSDCETILPLYLEGGARALADLEGMYALAVWDRRTRTLTLARDRAGEKPLFWTAVGREVWFGSEIPALVSPAVSRDLDDAALSDYLALGYVREPRTMFRAVRQVLAGTIHTFAASGSRHFAYWNAADVAGTTDAAAPALQIQRLRELLTAAVTRQATADVPIGVFLSGGVDSAVVAALAAGTVGNDRVRAFSVGFAAQAFDERAAASETTRALGLKHTVVSADEPALQRAFDGLAREMAEPLADPALLPTYLLAQAAREHVTVVLGGEGADELFGGYPTYQGHRLAALWQRLPPGVRRAAAGAVRTLPATRGAVGVSYLLHRFVAAADQPWAARHEAWFGTGLPRDIAPAAMPRFDHINGDPPDVARAAGLLDFQTYLRDDLLVKLDRATMRVALEARAPYLDRAVTEFALRLPRDMKVRGLTGKWILRAAAAAWLPRASARRRKRGLSVPVSSWINGGLAGQVDRLLEPGRLSRQGVLSHLSVARLLQEHRLGQADHGRALWALTMLQLWLERFGGSG